ncbi:autophagy protein 5 [Tritrichomonas musculus]|uniref:Autophagy protein 5 n=1 Tax=Tritrichomonas musculus TaxID=1915356 RepID=A0ABR2ICY0_9EUKA
MSDQQITEIREQVFNNTVPLRVEIENQPVPFCFNAPRLLSLGVFIHQKLKSFLPLDQIKNIWFSYNHVPIKWTLPIGVIYDSIVSDDNSTFTPLNVKVSFDKFPNNICLRCESIERAQYYFCHLFKESIFLTDKNQELLTQNEGIHQNIENALQTGEFKTYISLFQKRLEKGVENWKRWPIKFVTNEVDETTPSTITGYLEVSPDQTIEDILQFREFSNKKAIVQGIEINHSTKLTEIVPLLINPDGFFYIVLK